MKLIPSGFFGHHEKLDFPVAAYAPRSFQIAETAVGTSPLGAMCAFMGDKTAAVHLHKELTFSRSSYATNQKIIQEHKYWRVSCTLFPPGTSKRHFCQPTWGALTPQSVGVGSTVRFSPSRMKAYKKSLPPFRVSQRIRNLVSAWDIVYLECGLSNHEVYVIETVYPEPYIKVFGVSIVMSADLWEAV